MSSHAIALHAKSKRLAGQISVRSPGWVGSRRDLYVYILRWKIDPAASAFSDYSHQLMINSATSSFRPYVIE